jgi:anti-sigma B factor antagonist
VALTIDQRERRGCTVLDVAGDLDVLTAPDLVSAALAATEVAPADLIIDASGIDFCDSSGLAAFVRIGNQLGAEGHRLAIAGAQPIVNRIIEISGLHEVFVVAGTVEEAMSRLEPDLTG